MLHHGEMQDCIIGLAIQVRRYTGSGFCLESPIQCWLLIPRGQHKMLV